VPKGDSDDMIPSPKTLAAAFACVLGAPLAGTALAGEGDVTFDHQVLPILKAHCFHCHGEEEKLRAGLDLRFASLIREGSESGSVLVEGDREASLLYRVLAQGEMPPYQDKLLSAEEIEVIGRWIDGGALVAEAEPDPLPAPGEFFIFPTEQAHWAFQPLAKPAPPADAGEEIHPVDAFVGAKLAESGLDFSPEADRATLLRRAALTLTGLPPTPGEVRAFVEDESPDAWERVVERLLDSPHYGERWGRHWLDVAGYADSEGYNDRDDLRPDSWGYRDYVIRSVNADKPWDRFLLEQIAGDELVRATHANAQGRANADPEVREMLTATGFLRQAPDGTGSRPDDPDEAREMVINETVNIVASSLLGVTVGCAQCHDHRFDPVPQTDFFRMRAIFEPVYDPENWRQPSSRRSALISPEDKAVADEIEARAKEVEERYIAEMERVVRIIFERELEQIPEEERAFGREAYETPVAERSEAQKEFLADKYPAVNVQRSRLHLFLAKYEDAAELRKDYEELKEEMDALRAEKPQPDFIRVATEDTKNVPPTRLFHRGDPTSPVGDPLPPGDLAVLGGVDFPFDDESLATTGRRLAYARHLTTGEHPLVGRVLVNRFWMHHFGSGLVSDPGEFGVRSTGPSHPELLDWLASEFVERGWSLKEFHRLVMSSRTWRQSSAPDPAALALDSDNILLWRMPPRRLEAESVRDAILAVSGTLNPLPFGPPVPVAQDAGGLFSVGGGADSEDGAELRRSVYVQQRRTEPVAMLEAFDAPRMEPNCERRVSSTVATQALELMNGSFVLARSEDFAKRLLEECGDSAAPEEIVARAWAAAYGTEPDETRRAELAYFLERQEELLADSGEDAPLLALASLCQVLFQTNQFLYID